MAVNSGTILVRNSKIKAQNTCALYTVSALLLIASVAAFVGVLAVKRELSFFGNYFEYYLRKPILLFLATSVLIFADSCLGIISIVQKWYHGVIAFLACTSFLFVSMIVLIVLTHIDSIPKDESMYTHLEEDMMNYTSNSEFINAIQLRLHCCGYNNYTDWKNGYNDIPESCCNSDSHCDTENRFNIQLTGCHEALRIFLDCYKLMVAAGVVVLGIIEIVSIALSFSMCRKMNQKLPDEPPTAAIVNEESNGPTIPRIHNPLGRSSSLSSVDNRRRSETSYVRRPSQLPAILDYRSPHESYLRHPPQIRFDRRVVFPSAKHENPYLVRPG